MQLQLKLRHLFLVAGLSEYPTSNQKPATNGHYRNATATGVTAVSSEPARAGYSPGPPSARQRWQALERDNMTEVTSPRDFTHEKPPRFGRTCSSISDGWRVVQPRYKVQELLHQYYVIGYQSLPLVGITGFIMGIVLTL